MIIINQRFSHAGGEIKITYLLNIAIDDNTSVVLKKSTVIKEGE